MLVGETILHIGYDSVLTELREGVLTRARYCVVSVLGNEAGRESVASLQPDLVVIGSGGHYEDRLAMATWLAENSPQTCVLAMCAAPEEQFPESVQQFYGDTPSDWLAAVDSLLKKTLGRARRSSK
jgi:hypothetical protein